MSPVLIEKSNILTVTFTNVTWMMMMMMMMMIIIIIIIGGGGNHLGYWELQVTKESS